MEIEKIEECLTLEQKQEQKQEQEQLEFIKNIIDSNKSMDGKEEECIEKDYEEKSPREKVNILYEKLISYNMDELNMEIVNQINESVKDQIEEEKDEETFKECDTDYIVDKIREPSTIEHDPYLISELKILSKDEEAMKMFSDMYSKEKIDAKIYELSELGNHWAYLREEIETAETKREQLMRELYLGKIEKFGRGKVSATKSQIARLAKKINSLEESKKTIEQLTGIPKICENTDIAALFQYETLKSYNEQLKEGFVWLPSREKIHKEIISSILNHRWPILLGEAGTGKSYLAEAAASELTGQLSTKVACNSKTGEYHLIESDAIDQEGGSYKQYGALMQAFTGYSDSKEKTSQKDGRIVVFDEFGMIGPEAYAIIKAARLAKTGDDFYGRPVLSGAGGIGTSNPVGQRYPGRHDLDPAMRREFSEIIVDYPEMSKENPELYEFLLASLLNEDCRIMAAKEELTPAFEKREIPENEREILKDGSMIVAENKLIEDTSDLKHGALWRFANAIKALQDSFVCGNSEIENYPDTLLRFEENKNGSAEIVNNSGEALTLSTSTITLGEVASWMSGFNDRMQKQNKEFHTDTLTEWLNFKIRGYIKQSDKIDRMKLEAIFKHFHFLEDKIPDLRDSKPLTPKEIGYLSPRTPRPVDVKKKKVEKIETEERKEIKEYKETEVVLENGEWTLIKDEEFNLVGENGEKNIILPGRKINLEEKNFSFVGIIQKDHSKGMPVGQLCGEKLYRIFNNEELDLGISSYEALDLKKYIEEEMSKLTISYFEENCVNNPENNPKLITLTS